MSVWTEHKKTILATCVPKDTPQEEVNRFFVIGEATNADPLAREIYLQGHRDSRASEKAGHDVINYTVFHARDYYRRVAQEQEAYDGHFADAIYENDDYEVIGGIPKHKYAKGDRGRLTSAYCIVYKRKIRQPIVVRVLWAEYGKTYGVWRSSPMTMLTKVPEAQALRAAFQGVFKGTYSEDEDWSPPDAGREIFEAENLKGAGEENQNTNPGAGEGNQEEPTPLERLKFSVKAITRADQMETMRKKWALSLEQERVDESEYKQGVEFMAMHELTTPGIIEEEPPDKLGILDGNGKLKTEEQS